MKYLQQFLLLMIFVFLGEACHILIPLPVPGSIYGLVLLLTALATGIVKLHQIEDVANFFLGIILVLFIAPAVGILETGDMVAAYWPYILGIVVLAYLATFTITGCTAQVLSRRKKK